MTSDYFANEFQMSPMERARGYLNYLGINPNIADMWPINYLENEDYIKQFGGESGAVYDSLKKSIFVRNDQKDNPSVILHEMFHGIEDSLNPAEKTQLQALMIANPPEGKQDAGFIGYPAGGPTQHHQINSGWGLASYIDYNYPTSGATPAAEQFRSSVQPRVKESYLLGANQVTPAKTFSIEAQNSPPWYDMPDPIKKFLQNKFPQPYWNTSSKSSPWTMP